MPEIVTMLQPKQIEKNPDNPRLIFHEDELRTLQESIAKQGILVPLTVFQEGKKYMLLDGERRWRCASSLGLVTVPVIIQPKPDKIQNLMMMFAIHNARKDWDPLPTALKLEELEKEYKKRYDTLPSETELSGIASLPRGEVRRLKKLLNLPISYRKELMAELEKPRSEQILTVDQVIETTAGVDALVKKAIIKTDEVESFRRAIIDKFKIGVINNTVAPRKLTNLARAVERKEISISTAKTNLNLLLKDKKYSIDDLYQDTVERVDFEHGIEQIANRLLVKLSDIGNRKFKPSDKLRLVLKELLSKLKEYA